MDMPYPYPTGYIWVKDWCPHGWWLNKVVLHFRNFYSFVKCKQRSTESVKIIDPNYNNGIIKLQRSVMFKLC